jgi:TRAP-type mannitol/chloroaromatic compound transport system permease small subunit
MEAISRGIDALNDRIGRICSYSAFLLILIVLFEVISRRIFNRPTIWTFEVICWFYGFHFMMTLPYVLLHNAHVNMDLVVNRFNKYQQAIISIIAYCIFFFPFVGGLTIYSLDFAVESWAEAELSWSPWSPPLYYIKTVMPVSFFLLLLQGVSEVIKKISFLKNRDLHE